MNGKILNLVLMLMLVSSSLLGPLAPVTGANALGEEETLSPQVADSAGFFGSVPDEVVRYGADAHPMFIIEVKDGSASDLESWANQSDDREMVEDLGKNEMLVAASLDDVTGSFLSDGLAAKSYVADVDYNMKLSVNPVEAPKSESAHQQSTLMDVVDYTRGDFGPNGVAYSDDFNESTPEDVRQVIGDDNVSAEGSNVDVAVLDTGLNTANGAVFGNGSDGSTIRVDASYNALDDTNGLSNVSDGNGHGTWVASMIAANHSNASYDGVAPQADLHIGKVLADDGSGSTADIVKGLDWACSSDEVDVVSMSLGSPVHSDALEEAVTDCANSDDKVVSIAVGNSRINPATRYISSPADADSEGVIAVAASNVEEPADGDDKKAMSAYFSEVGPDSGLQDVETRGQGPDVAAPGTEITAKTPTEDGFVEESTLSGTSMATPVVSGSIAVAMDAGSTPTDNPQDVREDVRSTTTVMPEAGTTEVGAGLVDVENLVNEDTHPVDEQEDARNEDAVARDSANRALSTQQTGLLDRAFSGLGEVF